MVPPAFTVIRGGKGKRSHCNAITGVPGHPYGGSIPPLRGQPALGGPTEWISLSACRLAPNGGSLKGCTATLSALVFQALE